jgi:transposase
MREFYFHLIFLVVWQPPHRLGRYPGQETVYSGFSPMPKAYDDDLRRKVTEAIELNGMKRCEASELFGISRNTIHQWFQLKTATGDVKPNPTNHRGHSHKITDWDKFRTFVTAHPDKTQVELAQLWQGDISDRTISRALQQIGLTRKKRPMATESAMTKSESISVNS